MQCALTGAWQVQGSHGRLQACASRTDPSSSGGIDASDALITKSDILQFPKASKERRSLALMLRVKK